MRPTRTILTVAVFAFAALATVGLAQTQSRSVLGKIDFQALMDAAPGMPANIAEAGRRAYGADITSQSMQNELDSFYAPFNQRVAAARAVIQPAVANRTQNEQALAQRSMAQANASPIISGMGGVERMGQMSEEELKQAAAQSMGSYQQSLSGAPPNASGGGMQAMMQRLMSDPAYQARFEKMSKTEQEAELRKYMGAAPPPPTGETAAERQARQATAETSAVVANQKELGALIQRLGEIDLEFGNKDRAILATPGGHDEIAKDVGARIAKLPLIPRGEAGPMADPAKLQVLHREQATRDRTRAAWELQQRAALYTQRKTRYKEVATAYATWLRQKLGGVNSQTAQLLDDSNVEIAVRVEEDLIKASENLARYTSQATSYAAAYESSYQKTISEPLIK